MDQGEQTRYGTSEQSKAHESQAAPFRTGALVLVTLNNPREKFWGVLLDLSPAGVGVRGIDLNSFDDFVRLVRAGESATLGVVFFPMHRVDRMELDLRSGGIPSLGERFEVGAGTSAAVLLGKTHIMVDVGSTMREVETKVVEATLNSVHHDYARAAEILGISVEELRSVVPQ